MFYRHFLYSYYVSRCSGKTYVSAIGLSTVMSAIVLHFCLSLFLHTSRTFLFLIFLFFLFSLQHLFPVPPSPLYLNLRSLFSLHLAFLFFLLRLLLLLFLRLLLLLLPFLECCSIYKACVCDSCKNIMRR